MLKYSVVMILGIVLLFGLLGIVESAPFKIKKITQQLEYPWGIVFIDDKSAIVTEKQGTIKHVDLSNGKLKPVYGGPQVFASGQGGLLDIVKHPLFDKNRILYFSYSKNVKTGNTTAVAKGRLIGDKIENLSDILVTNAISSGSHHFGSRLAFDKNGLLFVTVGERGDRNRAQSLKSHGGKVLRIKDDGSIPDYNPFVDTIGAKPEIYSWGHRNPQGLVYDLEKNRMWVHEHGPRGGDELNLLMAGTNYGWPVITYGREYSGQKITDKTHHSDMAQPAWQWTPSIAPSGMLIVTGKLFSHWKGDLLVGALKFRLVSHLLMDQNIVKSEKRYLKELGERVRTIKMGPGGYIYLLTDSKRGQLVRLSPN